MKKTFFTFLLLSIVVVSIPQVRIELTDFFSRLNDAVRYTSTPATAVLSQPQTYTFTTTLKMGLKNNADVKVMQAILVMQGFLVGAIDGNFGSVTRTALVRFQRANYLAPDGIAGPATRSILSTIAISTIDPSTSTPPISAPATNSSTPTVTVASPIYENSSVTLKLDATNVASCDLLRNGVFYYNIYLGGNVPAISQTLTVNAAPAADYSVVCYGAVTAVTSNTVTVVDGAAPIDTGDLGLPSLNAPSDTLPVAPAPTITFSVLPTSIVAGQPATLTWVSTDATSCAASNGWTGTKATSGTQTITPTTTTTYALFCNGAGGTANQSVSINVSAAHVVNPIPTVSLSLSPTSITSGQSTTLTWSSTGATTCTASHGWTGSRTTSGTLSISPTINATYVLTCTGPGGSANQSADLTVTQPAPTVSLSLSPTSITSGQSTTLTWSSVNATSCAASNGWTGTKGTSGTQSVSPTITTTYALSCTGAGGTANQSVSVTVSQPVVITPPPTGPSVYRFSNFSEVANTTYLISNGDPNNNAGWWNTWGSVRGDQGMGIPNPSLVSLDLTGGPTGGHAMKYSWPARPNSLCMNDEMTVDMQPTLREVPNFGNDIWIKFTSKESAGFQAGNPACAGVSGFSYKYFLMETGPVNSVGANGRFGIYLTSNQNTNLADTVYTDIVDRTSAVTYGSYYLGNSWTGVYHTWVIHLHRNGSTTVTFDVYIDGVLRITSTGPYFPGNTTNALQFTGMEIGANINHGPSTPQSRTFGEVGIYYSQPSLQ